MQRGRDLACLAFALRVCVNNVDYFQRVVWKNEIVAVDVEVTEGTAVADDLPVWQHGAERRDVRAYQGNESVDIVDHFQRVIRRYMAIVIDVDAVEGQGRSLAGPQSKSKN